MKENNKITNEYETSNQNLWHGRNDGNQSNQLRWWQHIQTRSLTGKINDFDGAPVLLGFACDEGVARNKGRIGSVEGPAILRKALCNLPIHNPAISIFDVGTIHCFNNNLEIAQTQLSAAVKDILSNNGFPVLLGGGHEILYGHFIGTSKYYENKKIGVINFDAHFDNRKPENNTPTSGTGFYQMAEDCKNQNKPFQYLALGIQQAGNTAELFERAQQTNTQYVLAQDFHFQNLEKIKKQVQEFLNETDVVCLTIDLDVFSASIAPGVSAPAAAGIFYDYTFQEILKMLAKNNKVVSIDIAEHNPKYDIDLHTAKLAAQLLFDWVNWKY